ncbi:MAG: fatty acid--CoA ligase family protein, partial [Parvularculaceae bacterium]|nr:fatty acid--CoA ligase family protein [Parvularculaceae bacterium]
EDFRGETRTALGARGAATLVLDAMTAMTATRFALRPDAPPAPAPRVVEILTSGTTGPPKPFALSYDLLEGVVRERAPPEAEAAAIAPFLLYFPLSNISGIYSALPPLIAGQRIVLLDRFGLSAWRDYVVRHRPTRAGLPPSFVQGVLDADIPKADLSSLEALGVGAAPLDPDVQRAFEERYGVPVLLSYGATEFGGPVAATTLQQRREFGAAKIGSVGRPIGGAKLRVIDPDTDAPLPPGAEGVLEVVAPRIGAGWIRTADLAVLDADGFLFLRGRADGAIMRGGFKILPETVEKALLLHPSVADAAVIGISDRRLGEVPAAAVKLKASFRAPTPQELETHLRGVLNAAHIPTKVLFLHAFPVTVSLKTDRGALRRMLETSD